MAWELDYDIEQVRRIAAEVRSFLETKWPDVHKGNHISVPEGMPPSYEMCRLSTAFLKAVLEQDLPEVEWQCVGGSPELDEDVNPEAGRNGGYRSRIGLWHAHYWVTDGDYSIIADVTSDQFGGDPVTVKLDDGPTEYRENYFEGAVEVHMRDAEWRAAAWMQEWAVDHAPGWSSAEPAHKPT